MDLVTWMCVGNREHYYLWEGGTGGVFKVWAGCGRDYCIKRVDLEGYEEYQMYQRCFRCNFC